MKRVGTLWAPALGLGGGLGQAEGWERWRVGQDILLIVVVAWGSPHPLRRVFFLFFCASQKWKGTTSGGRCRARSLAPHRPSPVTSAGWPARKPAASSERPSPRLDSFRGGNTVWLFTAPGRASWLQSQLAAAWARSLASLGPRAPAACVLASQTLDFFFPCLSSFFMRWQIWVFFLVSFLSFSLPFSFPWLTREASGRGRLGEL